MNADSVVPCQVKVVQKTSKLAFKQKKEDISLPHLDFGMSLWYAWYAILRLQIYDELEVGQLNKAPSTEIRTFLGSRLIFSPFFMHKNNESVFVYV